ncbi:hypothetical protein MSBR3_0563 [Methanosarcina barkeri 3]|uniref:Guanylate cyclase domain-containing protein n=1 Tax=Methanosarcina barkeri 3 TaxID=1434107 RepID=A0A0E3SIH7_METBA|nr:hypothetical protein [Methanosarcina barkeri]AKB81141.1 hypothetical protein MSBR3_0563 [Methanosarcina barkeri 3]
MPLDNFYGQTFVAFIDISGFKQLMKEGRAEGALDIFYTAGYNNTNREIGGIFVSDCGILFWGNDLSSSSIPEKRHALESLLSSIRNINHEMCHQDFILTTSIAYGYFSFQERIETAYIRKNPIYGDAYLNSFLDNENGTPKIQPGQCRIVTRDIPSEVLDFDFLKRRSSSDNHYYYYWMVNKENDIRRFEEDYKDSYNLKYGGMRQALQRYSQ